MAKPRSISSHLKEQALKHTQNFIDNLSQGGLQFLARGPADTTMNFTDPDFVFRKQNNSYSGTDCTAVIIYNQKSFKRYSLKNIFEKCV